MHQKKQRPRPVAHHVAVALDASPDSGKPMATAETVEHWKIQDVTVPSELGQLGMRCALDALGAKVLKSTPVMVSCPNGRRVPGTVLTVGYPV